MSKVYRYLIWASSLSILIACSDSSNEESSFLTPEDSLSSSSLVVYSSSHPVDSDTSVSYDTVSVFIDDTTGKELHYLGNSTLRITEVMTQNISWLDHDGEDPGWVEIYNAGPDTADLRGYSLVEKLDEPRKWIIDKLIIPPGELRVVFCSGKDFSAPLLGLDSKGRYYRAHTNWKLEKDGGSLYLIDYNWAIRDSVNYPALDPGLSWGIINGGEWRYFEVPTPEKKNTVSESFEGFASEFALTPAGGFYADGLTLEVPQVAGGEIRCTDDGSEPTQNSELFTEAMDITRTTVIRCALFEEGKITNTVITETYFVGESIKMPVVAISVSPEFFANHYIKCSCGNPDCCPEGLYEDVEFPVHVEFFENGSSTAAKSWEIDAGISLMGNYSRMEDKKSVAVVMREQYQDGRLHYPLFTTRPEAQKFKAFNLRNNGNRFVSDYIADAAGGAILEGSGVDYQRSRQVVVFYNGEYYGIHDMRERFNEHYVETNYGIDAGSVDIIKHLGHDISVSGGSSVGYEELLDFVAKNDFSGANNANYTLVQAMMDVGNFADYMAAEIYIHNGDWPNNNVRAWRSPEQPWKFMIYDLDHGFDWSWVVSGFSQNSTNMFDWIKRGGGGGGSCAEAGCFANLFNKLIQNPDFKRLFVNRSAVMLEKYLNSERLTATIEAMVATLDPDEMARDLERFDREKRGYGFSKSGSSIKEWARTRDSWVREDYAEEFGVGSTVPVTLSAQGNGTVLMEGMNLLESGAYTGNFFSGHPIQLTAVPSGAGVFSKWEDGSTQNPRIVIPTAKASYSAVFK